MDKIYASNGGISVIISSYSGNEPLIENCISSLEHQTLVPDEIVILVDTERERRDFINAIHQQTIPLKIVASNRSGLVAARNKGIEESKGEIVAFIDDDAEADQHWTSEIRSSFSSNPAIMVVGGAAKPRFHGKPIPQSLYWIVGCTSEEPPTKRPIGCNMAFRREVFDQVGKFDENLVKERRGMGISEETELFLRIHRNVSDSIIYYNPKILVYHNVPERRTQLGYMLKRAFAEGGAKEYTVKKYGKDVETSYLWYYVSHLNFLTFMVLCSFGFGYLKGVIFRRKID